jgi:hypothetical protein
MFQGSGRRMALQLSCGHRGRASKPGSDFARVQVRVAMPPAISTPAFEPVKAGALDDNHGLRPL